MANYDIWIMNANGSSPTQLTNDSTRQDFQPRFSPNGKRIVYTSRFQRQVPIGADQNGNLQIDSVRSEIWMIDNEGKNQTQLTAFKGVNDTPTWSLDGKRIIFSSNRGGEWNLWSMIPISETN
ncbi:MAG: TolB family protein [Candidatus Sericytochromatia bacterium]